MRTLGIDLAAQPKETAAWVLTWRDGRPETDRIVTDSLTDAALLELMDDADRVAIDATFGWPDGFVDARRRHVARYGAGIASPPRDRSPRTTRRPEPAFGFVGQDRCHGDALRGPSFRALATREVTAPGGEPTRRLNRRGLSGGRVPRLGRELRRLQGENTGTRVWGVKTRSRLQIHHFSVRGPNIGTPHGEQVDSWVVRVEQLRPIQWDHLDSALEPW